MATQKTTSKTPQFTMAQIAAQAKLTPAQNNAIEAAKTSSGGNSGASSGAGAVNTQGQLVNGQGQVIGQANPLDRYSPSAKQAEPTASELATPVSPLNTEVDTSQPSPQSVQANPVGQVGYDQALKNLQSGGLQGNDLQNATNSLKSKYQQGVATAKTQYGDSPTQAGQAMSMVQGALPVADKEPLSFMAQATAIDPNIDKNFLSYDEFMSPLVQKTSLVEEYQKLSKSLGIDEINMELVDAKRIIEGTEDDIRAEVTATGGFATDSQVLALANSRNKSLIKNYNTLLDTRNNAMTQLSTIMDLTIQDRRSAEAEFDRKMNFAFKVAEFKEKAIDNARSNLNSIVTKVGYAGLLASTNGSAYEQSLIEKTLGLGVGGLNKLATLPPSEEDQLDLNIKRETLNNLRAPKATNRSTQIIDVNGKKVLVDTQTGEEIKEFGGEFGQSELSNAYTKSNIETIDGLKNSPGLNNAVGSGFKWFSRQGTPLTGSKSDFIADVEKMTSQLTLENLVNAKAKGATFGALSEGEMRVLEASASKIGTWRQTNKDGKVVGYKASEKSFKKELDTISNFAKLDYILKGGSPSDVNVQQTTDGHLWSINSDGSMTQIR